MANTVIAIFEDHDSALQAERYLLEQGFTKSGINIKTAHYKEDQSEHGEHVKTQEEDHGEDGLINSLTVFFKNLFGDDEKDVSDYTIASENRTILTVHTSSDQDAEQVSNILDDYGAINVGAPSASSHPDDDNITRARAARIKSRIVERHEISNKINNTGL